uniref:uncharacterized protein PF3D7_1120000-like n=1 Tax=Myxine glutinosa TaxID=7769 RepID=UPI00358E5480
MEQMRVASGQEMQVMGEEIRRGVSEEVGGVREEVRHCKERMEKEVRKGTVKLQGGIEELTLGVEQLTVGQKELGDQVKKNTAVIEGLKSTQKEMKKDVGVIKKECQTVHEDLTRKMNKVVEVMEVKEREVREHIERNKVELEEELKGAHEEMKEVKQKLEEVEEGVSEIKKRRREDKKEIKEEVKELVQSLCSDRDDVLINRMRDSQVMEEKRRERGPGVSGDQYGRAYDAPGDLISLGVEIDPDVRERPRVRCMAGPEGMERGCEREGPVMGEVRGVSEQGCGGMEWVAGCGSVTHASTPTGVVFRGTGEAREPLGGNVLWGPGRFGPALTPQGATHGVRQAGNDSHTRWSHKVPLAPYDGG